MKSYHDIAGDGGSNVLQQVIDLEGRITANLAGVRHLVAVGSGKGGVGKSTLTFHLAALCRAAGWDVALLDADLNGPSQARLAGVAGTVPLPAADGRLALPRARGGFGVFSTGSLVPETEAVEFDSVSRGASHTWRATREFTLLSEVLERAEWGRLDALFVDLPPGAERVVQFAELLGPRASFVLISIPSELARGVVTRSVAALRGAGRRIAGTIENMHGYACGGCGTIRPLFRETDAATEGGTAAIGDVPVLGTVPFDPELARLCDRGIPVTERPDLPSAPALEATARALMRLFEEDRPR
ncbi:MAG TPA: P-loop NTPase [Candidatus Polarisedimenticolia bacterium]|nr:P-loop NTPase [Candidatus Polarisedimenticolia bacterium]